MLSIKPTQTHKQHIRHRTEPITSKTIQQFIVVGHSSARRILRRIRPQVPTAAGHCCRKVSTFRYGMPIYDESSFQLFYRCPNEAAARYTTQEKRGNPNSSTVQELIGHRIRALLAPISYTGDSLNLILWTTKTHHVSKVEKFFALLAIGCGFWRSIGVLGPNWQQILAPLDTVRFVL